MNRPTTLALAALLALVAGLAAPGTAQTVHRVGPGALPQIHAAIAIAGPGDVIEVQSGNYEPFTLSIPLTIRAAPGATVTVLPQLSTPVTLATPPGTVATLRGIRVLNPWRYPSCHVEVLGGTVFLEDCAFESSQSYRRAALEVTDAHVILNRCALAGYGAARALVGAQNHGLHATRSTIQATDCSFFGSYTTWDSYGLGGTGLTATTSDVHLVRCDLVGGGKLLAFANAGGAGIDTSSSRVWLADCNIVGGSTPGNGGHEVGIRNSGPAIQWTRSTIQGGRDQNGNRRPAFQGPQQQRSDLLGLAAAAPPIVRGSPFQLDFETAPGWPVWLFVHDELQANLRPEIEQPLAALPGTAALIGVLLADATGRATYRTTLPNLPIGLSARLHVTAVSGTTLPLQTMPPLGGVVR
ncbi:MAG: hypothetical protein NXI31_03570 [bacterium]|nr:hypothetical protein [bacterium]